MMDLDPQMDAMKLAAQTLRNCAIALAFGFLLAWWLVPEAFR